MRQAVSTRHSVREVVPGAALLLKFVERNEISWREAAAALGLKHPAVWQWAHSITIPVQQLRGDIEVWTGGAVPASSWRRQADKSRPKVTPYRQEH